MSACYSKRFLGGPFLSDDQKNNIGDADQSTSKNSSKGLKTGNALDNQQKILNAGDGDDRVNTGRGDDQVNAGDGDDRVNTGRGDDQVNAGDGDDRVNTGRGDDQVNAGDGDDRVNTGRGDDQVNAGDGDDRVSTGRGDDTIRGGSGNDKLNGGAGEDTAIFQGSFDEYDLTMKNNGSLKVEDSDGDRDGTDTLSDIEELAFEDGIYNVEEGTFEAHDSEDQLIDIPDSEDSFQHSDTDF